MGSVFVFSLALNNLNNGKLRGVKAVPAKDLTSNSDSMFASDRKVYATDIREQPKQMVQKKWIGGGCCDASDVSYRRRVLAAGASLNPNGNEISFMSKTEKNTLNDALNRCRNKGYCVPPKVRAIKQYTNVPII
jgi:hypothetical protein